MKYPKRVWPRFVHGKPHGTPGQAGQVIGENRAGVGDLLKQFSAKATAKPFAADQPRSKLVATNFQRPEGLQKAPAFLNA
jgi:hypothetical protein